MKNLKKRKGAFLAALILVIALAITGCGSTPAQKSNDKAVTNEGADSNVSTDKDKDADSSEDAASDEPSQSEKKVLRVGMECAYPPFNWTQDSATTPDGSEAVKIYGSDLYAYGYDVAVAKMIADKLGYDLEIHKVEWSSIGISMDSGDYDCIIAGMGRTAEREMSYSFTEPYYYRDNCIVVKKGGPYENVKGLSELNGTGCKLTTQLGTGWIPLLDQVEGAETGANYETTSECFMAVTNGVADICIVDLPTAKSAALTNDELCIIQLDENDTFNGDDEMVNVCIATRKDDTALRDEIQETMNSLGWNEKSKMDELMEKVLTQQPAAN